MNDLAAISFAALLVLILVVVIVQFILWLRVKYEVKADQAEWKGVIEDVKRQALAATEASGKAHSAAIAAALKADSAANATEAGIEKIRLKYDGLAESLAHLNGKTVARERSEQAAAARAAKRTSSEAASSIEDIEPGDENQQNLLAAAQAATQANGRAPGKPRIVIR